MQLDELTERAAREISDRLRLRHGVDLRVVRAAWNDISGAVEDAVRTARREGLREPTMNERIRGG